MTGAGLKRSLRLTEGLSRGDHDGKEAVLLCQTITRPANHPLRNRRLEAITPGPGRRVALVSGNMEPHVF